jgi:putative transposase
MPPTFIKAYTSVAEARGGIGAWLTFYNDARLHQALGYRTPREMFEAGPSPQALHQQEEVSIDKEKVLDGFVAPSHG